MVIKSWDYCRIVLSAFKENKISLAEMNCMDQLVGNPKNENTRFCLATPGNIDLVYMPDEGTCDLELTDASGRYSVKWFSPCVGGGSRMDL